MAKLNSENRKPAKVKISSTSRSGSLSPAQRAMAEKIRTIVAPAKAEGRPALTEVEGLAILNIIGIESPRRLFVRSSDELRAMGGGVPLLPGDQAVVKVISPEILHKTEMRGVEIVGNSKAEILASIQAMENRFAKCRVEGYTVNEFLHYEPKLGHEMLFGYRYTGDFGPVVSFGPGGIFTEYMAGKFKPGTANIAFSPRTATRKVVEEALASNVVYGLVCAGLRNTKPVIPASFLADTIMKFIEAAGALAAAGIAEFEVNPMVIRAGRGSQADAAPSLVALDCLATLKDFSPLGLTPDPDGLPHNAAQVGRPTSNIGRILIPQSAAVIGVSDKHVNNGRIILRNLINNGFNMKRIYVIKDGMTEIDGCRCVPDIASLPEKVDLFVLVIPAAGTPETLSEIAEHDKAWSVIVIPGGLEEKSGSGKIVAAMDRVLTQARERGQGPLINGGNCMGIRSVPGKYNTLFIPEYKLPMPTGAIAPIAVISQSGAYSICRISKHPNINARYVITLGNQMDLTIGDYLDYLKDDAETHVFAVYVEGFKALDGLKTLEATKAISDSGRTVIFYRGGRTSAGAGAAASHTASIAGDYPVTRELFTQAGAVVCDTLQDFDDAVTLFTFLDGKKVRGNRLGAVSNAGFECVAMADNLGGMKLASLSESTKAELRDILVKARVSEIVDVHNPLDITPMGTDDAYVNSFKAVMADEGTDLGIVGIVPFTVMMNSLAADPGVHNEDVTRADSVAVRYGEFFRQSEKPFVAVLDTGPLYDPLGLELEKRGVPVFRTADRALKMLEIWRNSPSAHY
ncbi:MAG: acetate--CoA ligase family protein [Spirochaetaceae bacterium]|nr:acetate--CoA ligase family protein [Spirochaetaceae bacterium]